MVTRRYVSWGAAAVALVATLAYLRDPPWLMDQTTGLRGWEQRAGEPRYRWSGGHASFFVRADAGAVDIPVSTTFDAIDARPMLVTVTLDDKPAGRVVLTGPAWAHIRFTLPPPGSRRVRRIDLRTSVTREGNHGVRIADVEVVPRS
jgi:hypothetical protein